MDWFTLSETAFKVAVVFYLGSILFYLVYLVKKPKAVGYGATGLAAAAVALHTLGLIFRWIEGGIAHPPFTNLYESLLFFGWGIAFFYLIVEYRYKFREGGAFILPIALGAIGAAALSPASSKEVGELLPALQSWWLHAHVAIAAMAYAGFVAAFGASILFLIKDGVSRRVLGLWANVFMAFMLLISDRLNILLHRSFTLNMVTGSGEVTGRAFALDGAGKILLVAAGYFVAAAFLYWLKDREEGAPWIASLSGKVSPFAGLVTGLGAISALIGLLLLWRASGYPPERLASMASGRDPELASMILAGRLHLELFGNPFKIIIICLVAFVGAVTMLLDWKLEWVREMLPEAERLDSMSYTIITIAFPLMTMVIVTGAVWAKYAFGHYWQWDPKETASLISWLIYTGYLHTRLSLNWSKRSVAAISIIGFASVVFTYLGVNVIGPGYHAYASF